MGLRLEPENVNFLLRDETGEAGEAEVELGVTHSLTAQLTHCGLGDIC